uniref:Corrinoid adenosyltransferase MMAB n=1 Tax=Arcella intermedia TaxID=1963864 RepID=A0A6B2LKN9_9EUKA
MFNGERRSKDDLVFKALGATDELNSHIGLARHYAGQVPAISSKLEEIQSRLLDIGSNVATPTTNSDDKRLARTTFNEQHVQRLEAWIDDLDKDLPPLRNFILPGGGLLGSQLHVCRSVCRRAETCVVSLHHLNEVHPSVLKYLNRLSDFLFVSARYAAQQGKHSEIVYKKSEE